MTQDEFLEAIFRIGVQWAGGAEACRNRLREAVLPAFRIACGTLVGSETKLDWNRLQELIKGEEKRVGKSRALWRRARPFTALRARARVCVCVCVCC